MEDKRKMGNKLNLVGAFNFIFFSASGSVRKYKSLRERGHRPLVFIFKFRSDMLRNYAISAFNSFSTCNHAIDRCIN